MSAAAPAGRAAARPEQDRLLGLEGYRAVAALLVLVYHVYQNLRVDGRLLLEGTWAGELVQSLTSVIDMFFVLSAFLLALPYLRRALTGERPLAAAEFLRRRAVRVVPLYYVVVLVVWVTRNGELPGHWQELVQHLTFTQTFDDERIFHLIGPAWSLAVEVQFYVVIALLGSGVCAWCRRLVRRGARIAVAAASGAVLVLAGLGWKLGAIALDRPEDDWSTWFSLPAKLDVFGFGVLLAVVFAVRGTDPAPRAAALLTLPAAALLVAGVQLGTREGTVTELRHTLIGAGFALVLAATVLAGPRSALVRALQWRPLLLLALLSYSLYLWHEPLMLWMSDLPFWPQTSSPGAIALGVALLLPVGLVVAAVSCFLVEQPAATLRHTRTADGRPRLYYGEGAG